MSKDRTNGLQSSRDSHPRPQTGFCRYIAVCCTFTFKIYSRITSLKYAIKGKATAEFELSILDRVFYGIVTVFLKDKEVVSDLFDQEEQAIESAYRKLASRFGLTALEGVCECLCDCNTYTDLTMGLVLNMSLALALCNR